MGYNKYYQTENLFGEPYPELIEFYSSFKTKGKLLDVGCGQGRDSIALAKLGYEVVGIDNSTVGIEQLNKITTAQNLPLEGIVCDIYEYSSYNEFDFILLDSMFHFGKKELEKETNLLKSIVDLSTPKTLITICIQNSGKKVEILNSILKKMKHATIISQVPLIYLFEDQKSKHTSETKYHMITVRKS